MRKRGVFSNYGQKGSLSLSMNAIVIVVLAFSMLGLGLFLTRSLFSDITDTTSQVNEQIKNQILDDLRTGNKKLSFTQTTVNVELRQRQDIAIGVKNTGSIDQAYCTYLEARTDVGEAYGDSYSSSITGNHLKFIYIKDPKPLSPQDADVVPIKIDAANAAKGLFQGVIKIYEYPGGTTICPTDSLPAGSPYAAKSFFINVI